MPGRLASTYSDATHATLQLIASALVDFDLTASEINALANLSDGAGRTVSQLGAAAGTRPTTLTSVLDRLERRGHVTRSTRAGDRRSVLVELTDSGQAAAAMIGQTLTEIESRALRGLRPDAVVGFHAVLDALTTERWHIIRFALLSLLIAILSRRRRRQTRRLARRRRPD